MGITEETRRESYNIIKPTVSQRKKIILDVLGNREMTANEIANELFEMGITPYFERNFASPRLTELKQDGKVTTVGKRLCSISGRNIAVWKKVMEESDNA